MEPVLRQAGGANLWGWGGPGANIQVALQQLACNSPFFEDTTNKNVKLSKNKSFFLNFLFTVKNSKTDANRLTMLSGFQVKLDGKSLATGTVDHQGRF